MIMMPTMIMMMIRMIMIIIMMIIIIIIIIMIVIINNNSNKTRGYSDSNEDSLLYCEDPDTNIAVFQTYRVPNF